MRWTVVIPIKSLPAAKSRLAAASEDAEAHRALVDALRHDTLAAADAADGVARILLVLDTELDTELAADTELAVDTELAGGSEDAADPNQNRNHARDGARTRVRIAQQRPGLNGALRDGADHAARTWPEDGVALLVVDLPALRPAELAEALHRAAAAPAAAFVPDADGTGTTMLAARPGVVPVPRFGPASARRHAEDAVPLPAGPGLRRDVDTPADLRAAARDVGVGPATAALLAQRDSAPAVHLGLG